MIYKFLLLSDEVEDFSLEVKIDPESTFLQLNDAIIEALNYTKDQLTSFFVCEDNWEKKTEITLFEMDTSSDEDSWTMDSTRINEFVEDEHQRLLFVYDMMGDRALFMELRKIEFGATVDKPVTKLKGTPPRQILSVEELDKKYPEAMPGMDIDNDYGMETGYNDDELDIEGFSGLDFSDDPDSYR